MGGERRRRETEERDGGERRRSTSNRSSLYSLVAYTRGMNSYSINNSSASKTWQRDIVIPNSACRKQHKQLGKHEKITNKNIFDNTMRNNNI